MIIKADNYTIFCPLPAVMPSPRCASFAAEPSPASTQPDTVEQTAKPKQQPDEPATPTPAPSVPSAAVD